MSDDEIRQKRAETRKRKRRDKIAKQMLDRTGPYKPKVRDARKGIYKREKIRTNDAFDLEE